LLSVLCAVSGQQAQSPPPVSQAAAANIQDSANDLYVVVGKTVLVDCARPIKRVALGLGDVAEAHAISRTEIMVSGKTAGETSLIIWDTLGGRQFFNVMVRAVAPLSSSNLEAIRRELKLELPGQTLNVSYDNNTVFLRGTVRDLTSSARAVQIASTAGSKVVNLLNVDVPASDPQILLKVRFASVDRTKSKQLGINFVSLGALNTVGGITTGQFTPPTITNVTPPGPQATFTNELNLLVENPGNLPFGFDIAALETKGIVQVLAEPNVIATNGKQASFLAGGEYPYPVVQGGSGGAGASVTIMFKEYGVRLNFVPTITPRGTIRLQVAPEVSSLDFTNAIEISGFEVPAIDTRKVKTEVELKDGQTLIIGGLLDNRDTETFQKIPFLGDIPILGKFFQSQLTTKTNTELIVIVTPEIVAPIQAGATIPELKYPKTYLPPNSGIPMNNPDAKTAANTLAPPPAAIPIEKLLDSLKPETPLVIEGATGTLFGAASSTTTTTSPSPAPPPQ
jgi:pilus assembly protein CpaC